MKLQIQPQALRLRLDEAELAQLLAGERLQLAAMLGSQPLIELSLELGDTLCFSADAGWRLQLPADELRAYVDTLPRRDALVLALAPNLHLDFEVDVRDSRKQRGRAN